MKFLLTKGVTKTNTINDRVHDVQKHTSSSIKISIDFFRLVSPPISLQLRRSSAIPQQRSGSNDTRYGKSSIVEVRNFHAKRKQKHKSCGKWPIVSSFRDSEACEKVTSIKHVGIGLVQPFLDGEKCKENIF